MDEKQQLQNLSDAMELRLSELRADVARLKAIVSGRGIGITIKLAAAEDRLQGAYDIFELVNEELHLPFPTQTDKEG